MNNAEIIAEGKEAVSEWSSPDCDYIVPEHPIRLVTGLAEALEEAHAKLALERERVESWQRIAATNRREADDAIMALSSMGI